MTTGPWCFLHVYATGPCSKSGHARETGATLSALDLKHKSCQLFHPLAGVRCAITSGITLCVRRI